MQSHNSGALNLLAVVVVRKKSVLCAEDAAEEEAVRLSALDFVYTTDL